MGQPVQARVEGGEPEGPRVDVHGDDSTAVPRGEQGLHPAPGAEVEHRADRPPHGERRQHRRRLDEAVDVIPGQGARACGREVTREEQALVRDQA